MKVRWYMERGDISILKSWFKFNRVCVEFRRTSWNLHEFEMLAGWISDAVCESGLDGAEMPFCGPGWRWVVTKMEVKHRHQDLNLVEKRPRWRREINLRAWLGVRCKSWDLAGVRWDTDWVGTVILRPEYVVMWLHLDSIIMTWIEVRRDLDCDEVWISRPGWTWQRWPWDANICNLDGAWMEVTQEYWDLNAGDAGSGWRWDTNLGTWIAPWWDLAGAEIQSTRPGWG